MAINNRSNLLTDPIRNFRFLVQFKPHTDLATGAAGDFSFKPTLGFTSVSGLAVQTESIPYREGGYNTTIHQIPGQTTFSPITMQRGLMLGTPQNWEWMRRLFAVVDRTGTYKPGFRADIDIWVLNHPQTNQAASEVALNPASPNDPVNLAAETAVLKFEVYNAWPTAVAYSDLNAGDNALLVEQMTLVHEGFNVTLKDSPTAANIA